MLDFSAGNAEYFIFTQCEYICYLLAVQDVQVPTPLFLGMHAPFFRVAGQPSSCSRVCYQIVCGLIHFTSKVREFIVPLHSRKEDGGGGAKIKLLKNFWNTQAVILLPPYGHVRYCKKILSKGEVYTL